MTAERRDEAFAQLEAEGRIIPVQVEGIRAPLYLRVEAEAYLERALSGERETARCEAIAPLDPMLWDRKLIRAIFGFDYIWEIYTPASKRKFGYYVLPLVYGEAFVGRVEAVADKKQDALLVKHVWLEDGVKRTKKLDAAIARCMKRLMKLNGCSRLVGVEEAL